MRIVLSLKGRDFYFFEREEPRFEGKNVNDRENPFWTRRPWNIQMIRKTSWTLLCGVMRLKLQFCLNMWHKGAHYFRKKKKLKYVGGSVIMWERFTASEPRRMSPWNLLETRRGWKEEKLYLWAETLKVLRQNNKTTQTGSSPLMGLKRTKLRLNVYDRFQP